MSPRPGFSEVMDQRIAHLEGLHGHQLKEDLEALTRCFHVFTSNAKELASHVGKFVNSSQFSKDVPDSYVNELVRFLHNYLTSVSSLIDSQRVVMRHRWPTGREKPEKCPNCKQPLPSRDRFSEFETKVYAAKLVETFETGEAVFMTKLRNYCTHYSIPLPTIGTNFSWDQSTPGVVQTNTLQLDRDKLLRWDSWGPAKAFLKSQGKSFDFAPIVERYVNAANVFAAWFWGEINTRSRGLIEELNRKAMELRLWQQAEVGPPDWVTNGDPGPPVDWNGRLWRARKRKARYDYGSPGFRV